MDQHVAASRKPRCRWVAPRALALLAFGCTGTNEIQIGAHAWNHVYIAPTGDDAATGRRNTPFRTFDRALSAVAPGHELILLPGTYTLSTTGLLSVRCGENAPDGVADGPIVIRADGERSAFLRGDGEAQPLSMLGCAHYVVEGLVLTNVDSDVPPYEADVGSTAVIQSSEDITLRRLIAARPNALRHSHGVRLVESSRVLLEENEVYDFQHNAFEAVRSRALTFRRNYVHSRWATSTYEPAELQGIGDIGFNVEECSGTLLENNVAESVLQGFAIVGRSTSLPGDDPEPSLAANNRLVGNIALGATNAGFVVLSRCAGDDPCTNPARVVSETELTDCVAADSGTGLLLSGAVRARANRFSALDCARGVVIDRGAENAGVADAVRVENSLVGRFTIDAFAAVDSVGWSFDHCAAVAPANGAVAFVPPDANVSNPVRIQPELGSCRVTLPPDSALRGAGVNGSDVGASILARSHSGVSAHVPLWDAASREFPCGARAAGINDERATSCAFVHERLNVGDNECAIALEP